MAVQGNVKYTNVILDPWIAIKAYRMIWKNPDCFQNILRKVKKLRKVRQNRKTLISVSAYALNVSGKTFISA